MSHKVLIVEDDSANRILLTTLLADAGYDVIAVSSLKTAMEALTDEAPDALIADVRLDGYNGLQLLAMSPRSIPAIMVTGFSDAALEHEAHQMGADYLLKPVVPSTLLALLQHKLAGVPDGTLFNPARRWTRKPVIAEVAAQVGDSWARILDVSYGGLRLEIDRTPGAWLPPTFTVALPASDVTIPMDVVWKRRSGPTSWLCGAAVSENNQPIWRELVDEMS